MIPGRAGDRLFGRRARQGRTVAKRKTIIARSHDLPVAKPAHELAISRGSIYSLSRPVSAADLALMRQIDELHMECPFTGSRKLRDLLAGEGSIVSRLHLATLMKRMAIEAI